jgi:hypothetical protein
MDKPPHQKNKIQLTWTSLCGLEIIMFIEGKQIINKS